jgi:hypothetical protein
LTVSLIDQKTIAVIGICALEDAEALLQLTLDNPAADVDWTRCERAHTAVIQILMEMRCPLRGPPAGTYLKAHIEPAILRAGG